MHGILVVNKPEGVTSFDVVRCVRRACGTRKVGHGGTLDPLATGVLPVAVGDGTRILEFLADGRKTYRATMRLGASTDTQDSQGRILQETPWDHLHPDAVRQNLLRLQGPLVQVPPMYSALKHQGIPLYRLARRGEEIERQGRPVIIHSIRIERLELPEVRFVVSCSKGTYVRTLAHDAGQELGVGAHLTALQRLGNGPFSIDDAMDLGDVQAHDWSRPPIRGWFSLLDALRDYPRGSVDADGMARLAHGIPPTREHIRRADFTEGEVVALEGDGELVAVARYAPEREQEKRGDFELLKVFHRR